MSSQAIENASPLERAFFTYWQRLAPAAPKPVHEYRFHPTRRWRLDFAWPQQRVAVEIQGGTYVKGRHVRGGGYRRDAEKLNALQSMGWRVFYVTAGMLREDPAAVITMVRDAIEEEVRGDG